MGQNAAHPLPRHGGDEKNWHIGQKVKLVTYLVFILLHGVGIFFNGVPFVYQHNNPGRFVRDHACYMGILSRNARFRVQQHQNHIGAFERFHGAQHAVFFDAGVNLAAPPDACRIDEGEILTVPFYLRVDGVAGCARDGADNDAFLANQFVHQRRFAYVGTA